MARRTASASITLHPAQQVIARSTARFRVLACGRRFGKTELGKEALLTRAQAGGICWWVAPTYRMAGAVWRDLVRRVRDWPDARIDRTDWLIDLPNGGQIAIRSASQPDRLRGAGLDFVVLDEAAFMPAAIWAEVIRPMLLDRRGGALFLSTPHGRNWFFDCYLRGLDPAEPEWQSFHFTTYDNPLIDPAELDALRAQTPQAVFAAEYLAEFTDDAGQVFRNVRDAIAPPPPFDAAHRYAAGIDWGRSHDYTVIVVVDIDARAVVALDRFREVGWEQQRGRLAALLRQWRVTVAWAEENSIGGPNIEALQREGLPVRGFRMTTASKAPLIEALALAIERGDLRLIDEGALIGELSAYGMTRLPGGGFRYSAPPGLHDDCVIALALAWHGAARAEVGVDFV